MENSQLRNVKDRVLELMSINNRMKRVLDVYRKEPNDTAVGLDSATKCLPNGIVSNIVVHDFVRSKQHRHLSNSMPDWRAGNIDQINKAIATVCETIIPTVSPNATITDLGTGHYPSTRIDVSNIVGQEFVRSNQHRSFSYNAPDWRAGNVDQINKATAAVCETIIPTVSPNATITDLGTGHHPSTGIDVSNIVGQDFVRSNQHRSLSYNAPDWRAGNVDQINKATAAVCETIIPTVSPNATITDLGTGHYQSTRIAVSNIVDQEFVRFNQHRPLAYNAPDWRAGNVDLINKATADVCETIIPTISPNATITDLGTGHHPSTGIDVSNIVGQDFVRSNQHRSLSYNAPDWRAGNVDLINKATAAVCETIIPTFSPDLGTGQYWKENQVKFTRIGFDIIDRGNDFENIVFEDTLVDAVINFNGFENVNPNVTPNATIVKLDSTIIFSNSIEDIFIESTESSCDFLSTNAGADQHDSANVAATVNNPSDCNWDVCRVESEVQLLSTEVQGSIHIEPHKGCDDADMLVPVTDGTAKKFCCKYCLQRFSKLVPHLETVHKNEDDVKKFRTMLPGLKARKAIINRIRKRGQFLCNTDKKVNKGVLQPSRRQNKKFKKTAADYITCAGCFGTFSSSSLRVHFKKCTDNVFAGERVVRALGRACEGRLHAEACEELNANIFAKMRQTKFLRLIRFDWLVVCYGNNLCLNFSPHFQHGHIKNKMRSAANLLFAAKSISSKVTDFSSLYHVTMCNTVIEAIRFVAKFDSKSKQFGSPATASALVTLINTIGEYLIPESSKVEDYEKEKNAERFLKVFARDARFKITKLVGVQKSNARRRKKQNIPTIDDVNKLALYLESERDKSFADLSQAFSKEKWTELSELTLVSILLFNRRRTGEMMNIELADYDDREMFHEQSTAHVLPDEVRQLIRSRLVIRNKRGITPVSVLLKHSFERCLEILIKYRKKVGVPDTNKFLFALPSSAGIIRTVNACNAVLAFSKVCEAKNPSSLRGTEFRKHLASFCSTKGLSDNDVTNLAKFMGHDDKIHRDYYRHNPLDREVTQMTSLLEEAQGNSINLTTTTQTRLTHKPKKTSVKQSLNSKPRTVKQYEPKTSAINRKTSSRPKRRIATQHAPKTRTTNRSIRRNQNVTQRRNRKQAP